MNTPAQTSPFYWLVTGASSGIGEAMARELASRGHSLILVARTEAALKKLSAELEVKHRITAQVLPADLGNADAAAQLEKACRERGWVVDGLVNCAGLGYCGALTDLKPEGETNVIQVNVTALVAMTRQFLPAMIARKRGHILNVASTGSFQPVPYFATYGASKAFVRSFSRAVAYELKRTGVTITCSCPGPVATAFFAANGMHVAEKARNTMMTARDVARQAIGASLKGRDLVIHGRANALLARISATLPERLSTWVAGKIFERLLAP